MSKNFKCSIAVIALFIALWFLTGCSQSMAILEGASHAKGELHLEGYFTDSQGDVVICKVPEEYTAEQAAVFCNE